VADKGRKEFGPRTGQFRRFISSFEALSREQRASISTAALISQACFGPLDVQDLMETTDSRCGGKWYLRVVERSAQLAELDPPKAGAYAMVAAIAVACADVIPRSMFRAAYGPVAAAVPVGLVAGRGRLPSVTFTYTLPERFASRAHALHPDEWEDARAIEEMLEDAVGERQVRSAAQTATRALPSKEARLRDTLFDEINAAALQAYRAYAGITAILHRVSGRSSATPDLADGPHFAHFEAMAADAAELAQMALLGLIVKPRITRQTFATLYLPFATVIPLDSLDYGLTAAEQSPP
jgi:hypothetical protein